MLENKAWKPELEETRWMQALNLSTSEKEVKKDVMTGSQCKAGGMWQAASENWWATLHWDWESGRWKLRVSNSKLTVGLSRSSCDLLTYTCLFLAYVFLPAHLSVVHITGMWASSYIQVDYYYITDIYVVTSYFRYLPQYISVVHITEIYLLF